MTTIDPALIDSLGLAQKTAKKTPSKDLGEDAFLKLVMAQLENQDPLKPMENGAFLSQLAQMKSVTSLDNLKNSFETLASSLQSNQALQASSLVGRWVMVPSDQGTLWKDFGLQGSVDVPSATTKVLVSIKDSAGQVVRQIDMGAQPAGTTDFHWDGKDSQGNDMTPGVYKLEAVASIGGKFKAISTNTVNPVESVSLNKGGAGLTLNLTNNGSVTLSDVQKVM